jgi:hypothetical protein
MVIREIDGLRKDFAAPDPNGLIRARATAASFFRHAAAEIRRQRRCAFGIVGVTGIRIVILTISTRMNELLIACLTGAIRKIRDLDPEFDLRRLDLPLSRSTCKEKRNRFMLSCVFPLLSAPVWWKNRKKGKSSGAPKHPEVCIDRCNGRAL